MRVTCSRLQHHIALMRTRRSNGSISRFVAGIMRADLIANHTLACLRSASALPVNTNSTWGARPTQFTKCQWPIRSAHWRPIEAPARDHEECPSMANRSAHPVVGGVGQKQLLL
jgi:hypothetical protein